MYRRLYNCLLYRYFILNMAVQETVKLLILQVPITVHGCTTLTVQVTFTVHSRIEDCTTAYCTSYIYTVHCCTGYCTTAYSTGTIYSTQLYRRLYNCLFYSYQFRYIAVHETVQLLILQVPITVHSCTGECTTAYSTGTNNSTQLYRILYNCIFYRYQLQYITVQETVQLHILQVPITVHSCKGDCTTAYSTNYSTQLYKSLLYKLHLLYVSVQKTVQQLTLQVTFILYTAVQDTVQMHILQVPFTVNSCTGDCTVYTAVQETVQLLILQVHETNHGCTGGYISCTKLYMAVQGDIFAVHSVHICTVDILAVHSVHICTVGIHPDRSERVSDRYK